MEYWNHGMMGRIDFGFTIYAVEGVCCELEMALDAAEFIRKPELLNQGRRWKWL